ncbi:MAG: hypothetical protein JWQ54_3299 [Mucilaginibacter sp.]|nr:hypothetical protein [Mucilaginibacter sp.]
MKQQATKADKSSSFSTSSPTVQKRGKTGGVSVSAGSESKLSVAANASAGVTQLRAYQQMADNSQRVAQLKGYQAMADNAPGKTVQMTRGRRKPFKTGGLTIHRDRRGRVKAGGGVDSGVDTSAEVAAIKENGSFKDLRRFNSILNRSLKTRKLEKVEFATRKTADEAQRARDGRPKTRTEKLDEAAVEAGHQFRLDSEVTMESELRREIRETRAKRRHEEPLEQILTDWARKREVEVEPLSKAAQNKARKAINAEKKAKALKPKVWERA